MIDIDISLFVEIIAVLILMAILNTILYKPIRKMLEERESKLAGLRGDVERFERNAVQLMDDFQKKLADARKAGVEERERMKNEARETERQLMAESTKGAEAQKQQLMADISSKIEATRKELSEQSGAFAAEMAQKLLGRAL